MDVCVCLFVNVYSRLFCVYFFTLSCKCLRTMLPKKLWLIFMGMKQKRNIEKKIQNGQLKKTACFHSANSKYIFPKISGISPWISRIVWCIGYRCDSTYMVLRLSDVSSKTLKKSLPPNIKPYWTTFFNYYQFVIYGFLKNNDNMEIKTAQERVG